LFFEILYGAGKILLSAVHYGQDFPAPTMLPTWSYLFGQEVNWHFLVKPSSPSLEVMVNKLLDGFLLGFFNNRSQVWRGEITVPDGEQWEILWPEPQDAQCGQDNCFALSVPAFQEIICRIAVC